MIWTLRSDDMAMTREVYPSKTADLLTGWHSSRRAQGASQTPPYIVKGHKATTLILPSENLDPPLYRLRSRSATEAQGARHNTTVGGSDSCGVTHDASLTSRPASRGRMARISIRSRSQEKARALVCTAERRCFTCTRTVQYKYVSCTKSRSSPP